MTKKVLALSLFVLAIVFSTLSCQKEKGSISDSSNVTAATSQMKTVGTSPKTMTPGEIHNYYLGRYFQLYGKECMHSPMTYEDDYLLTKRFNQMMKDDGLLPEDTDIDELTSMELEQYKKWGFYNSDGTLKSTSETTQLNIDIVENADMRRALQSIKNYNGNKEDFLNFGLEQLDAANVTEETDIQKLAAIRSVFESSYNFWNQYAQNSGVAMPMGWLERVSDADAAGYERGILIAHLAGIWDGAASGSIGLAYAASWSAKALY